MKLKKTKRDRPWLALVADSKAPAQRGFLWGMTWEEWWEDWKEWANTRLPKLFHKEWETAGACCPIRKRWELFACLWSGCNPFHIIGLRLWSDILKEDEPEWLFRRRIMYPRASKYTVVDSVRPIPEGLSEDMTSALFASAVSWGINKYWMYGRKRTQQSKNPDATTAMERKNKCMDRKMRYPLEYAPFKDRIAERITVYYESAVPALERSRIPIADGGKWGERKGECRMWHGVKKAKPEWLAEDVWKRLKAGPTIAKLPYEL